MLSAAEYVFALAPPAVPLPPRLHTHKPLWEVYDEALGSLPVRARPANCCRQAARPARPHADHQVCLTRHRCLARRGATTARPRPLRSLPTC